MVQPQRFLDRRDAGRRLARLLSRYAAERPIVVAIPRGGVPVAAEVARALSAPLDVIVARKLGAPSNPEYGIGAIAEGGARVISERALRRLQVSPEELSAVLARSEGELATLVSHLRRGLPPLPVQGRTVILVDDGLATGRTAQAAASSLRRRGAARVVLAVPVAAAGSASELRSTVEEVVCEQMPEDLWAIGFWYEDFSPTSEQEALALLDEASSGADAADLRGRDETPVGDAAGSEAGPGEQEPWSPSPLRIELGPETVLQGDLTVPPGAVGVVAFAHGSGSSRSSPRNRAVAMALNRGGLATLLLDLLTPEEERERANVFDVTLLAQRLMVAVRSLSRLPQTRALPVGCFGASTGAAAALLAAAELPERVGAVVCRGGRPDLALERLGEVRAPTLLIVGGEDHQVIQLNRMAQERLRCESRLEVIPGATHLFEEPGALERVGELACGWFTAHLPAQPAPPVPPR